MDNSSKLEDCPQSCTTSTRSLARTDKQSMAKVKNIAQFSMGEKLGEGTFGTVRIATHILTGERVAVKVLDRSRIREQADKTRIEREIEVLKRLHHANIIQLYSVINTNYTIYIVQEYASGKELFNYITSKKRLDDKEACKYFQQIISGIEYIHKLQIAHRDIKPENMLLTSSKDIKIVDFGLSNTYKKGGLLSTACGSPCYAAPEMLSGKKYKGLSVDIWSCGVVLYVMLCGYLPFEDVNNESLYKKIIAGKYTIPDFVSKPAKDLIKKILETNPKKRVTIPEIKKHKWFNIVESNVHSGIDTRVNVIPIDEEIVTKMESLEYNKEEVRSNVMMNEHNHITTTYYLLLKKKIRNHIPSVSDLKSEDYEKYLADNNNLLSNYGGNVTKAVKMRASSKGVLDDIPRGSICPSPEKGSLNQSKMEKEDNPNSNSPKKEIKPEDFVIKSPKKKERPSLFKSPDTKTNSSCPEKPKENNSNKVTNNVKKESYVTKSEKGKNKSSKLIKNYAHKEITINTEPKKGNHTSLNRSAKEHLKSMPNISEPKKKVVNVNKKFFSPNKGTNTISKISKTTKGDNTKKDMNKKGNTISNRVQTEPTTKKTILSVTAKISNKKLNLSMEEAKQQSEPIHHKKKPNSAVIQPKPKEPHPLKTTNNFNNNKQTNKTSSAQKVKKRPIISRQTKVTNTLEKALSNPNGSSIRLTQTINKIDNKTNIVSQFDLSCLFFISPQDMREKIRNILTSLKIKLKPSNAKHYFNLSCEKLLTGISFEIEILQLEDMENASVLKFKRVTGNNSTCMDIFKKIYLKLF